MTNTLLRTNADLPALAAALGPGVDLSVLADYLRYRERGPRARIAAPLAAFAAQASAWPFAKRRVLVRWIGEPWIGAAGVEPTSSFPKRGDPVFRAVVVPTLREWRAYEPYDPEPHLLACLWDEPEGAAAISRLECLQTLVDRFPDLLQARRAFVRAVVDLIGFNQHEWPHGYIGTPASDATLLDEAQDALRKAPDDAWRRKLAEMLRAMQNVAQIAQDPSRRSNTEGQH